MIDFPWSSVSLLTPPFPVLPQTPTKAEKWADKDKSGWSERKGCVFCKNDVKVVNVRRLCFVMVM